MRKEGVFYVIGIVLIIVGMVYSYLDFEKDRWEFLGRKLCYEQDGTILKEEKANYFCVRGLK